MFPIIPNIINLDNNSNKDNINKDSCQHTITNASELYLKKWAWSDTLEKRYVVANLGI